jgi:hypothetical protein
MKIAVDLEGIKINIFFLINLPQSPAKGEILKIIFQIYFSVKLKILKARVAITAIMGVGVC